jgi:hypothetical protein
VTAWLDIVLIEKEEDLRDALEALSGAERDALISTLSELIGTPADAVKHGLLRVLIERARPFAMPRTLWNRSRISSDPVLPILSTHLASLGLELTSDRIRRLLDLQFRYGDERERDPVDIANLIWAQGFRCALCGLKYYNEELEAFGTIVAPHGLRGRDKIDQMKPHWGNANWRRPVIDHVWPVSGYGSNRIENLQAICNGCNIGKANFVFFEQTAKGVGILGRNDLLGYLGRASLGLFVAQILRQSQCADSHATSRDTELTIRIVNPSLPMVIDNLETIALPD